MVFACMALACVTALRPVAHAVDALDRSAPPQEVVDAELEAASAGRTLRVRLGVNGLARIVHLPLELYVSRVLAAEAEPKAGAAAQQALAVAIRTFAVANSGRHRRDGFDLCDTTHCQVLRPSTSVSRLATLATASQLLTYEGRPAEVFYSASCGGRSEAASQVWAGAGDLPYLQSSRDDVHGDDEAWVLEVPVAQVEQALRRIGFDGRRLKDVSVERRSESGRVTRLQLAGLRPDVMTGEDFRAAVGARELRSTQFTVEKTGNGFRFTGRGYGHGVGMCVVGAGRRAARGESAAQILGHYYPGLRLHPLTSLSEAPMPEPAPESAVRRIPSSAEQLALRLRSELASVLGIDPPPAIQVQLHESLEAFRHATGRPWWVTVAVNGSVIDLAPMALLVQRDGLEASVRRGVAEALVADGLADRPAWVRVGAARYYAATPRPAPPARRVKCPSDAELTMAVSAPAHRDAELRAQACFARALAAASDWRQVR
jgi:SpoIID/LytB domain protein